MSGKTTNDEFFTLEEIERFADGSHCRLHEKLGAHPIEIKGEAGTRGW